MNMRSLPLLILTFFTAVSSLKAQSDTTEYLFKKARYSYMQYSLGYAPMFFSNGQVAHGFTGSCGVVLNDRLAITLDVEGFNKMQPVITTYPTITSYVSLGLGIEPLIRPKKILNFSVPIRIGWVGAQIYDITPQNYVSVSNPQFLMINPGAMVWVNLFKPLSIGGGAGYRMPISKASWIFESFGGITVYATLRFKFYTREWNAKMMERQRQYMQQNPQH